jgi:hypothetical protein
MSVKLLFFLYVQKDGRSFLFNWCSKIEGGFTEMANKRWLVLMMLVTLLFCVASVFAQGPTGQISGTVIDQNGARITSATVKATNQGTALERTATTSADGEFSFTLLPPGRYKLEVSAQGFSNKTVEAIVNITQTTVIEINLEVGSVVDGNVVIAAPLIQAESSQNGRVVEGDTIKQLPLPTRNFQQLLTLSAGTSSSVSNNTELGRGDSIISVNGQRTTSNSVRINGVDANSIGTNSTPNIAVPATDSLQEFIVQTSQYDASSGRNAGGNVEAVTRSGGNEFHGNAYYFLRNDSLNANDFFLNSAGRPRPVLVRHQGGATLGGPIIKDKLFFFGSFQGTRERNGASLNNSLTFPIMPAALRDDNRTAAALSAAFGVPAASITPQSLAILNAKLANGAFLIPSATTPSGLSPQSGISRFRERQFNANGDLNLSDKHTFSAKIFFASNPTEQANYNFAGLGNGPLQLPGTGGNLSIIQQVTSLSDTYVFSSNIVNQVRVGFSRLRVTSAPIEPFTAAQLGISNPLGNLFPGMPTVTVTGAFTTGSSPFADQSSRINAFSFQDNLSWNVGSHRIRIGGEFRPSQVNFYFNAFSRGQVIFNPGVGVSAFQNFLIGNGISILGSGVYDRAYRVKDFGAYIQDDWKITDRLTFNLGLRYDLYGLPRDIRGRLVNFIPEQFRAGTTAAPAGPPNGFVQAGNATNPIAGVPLVEDTLVPSDKNNFAPRVGFAYQITKDGKLVVRGGYGIYYDRISTRYANTQLLNFPYLALAVGLVNSLGPPTFRTFASPFISLPQPGAFPVNATVPSPLSPLAPVVGVPISGIFINPDLATPYVQQYSANVQWEFAKNYLLEVGYVGNNGRKLLQVLTLNQPVYNRTANNFTAPFGTVLSTQKNVAGGIQQAATSSNSHYDSLQVSVTRRFTKNLQFLMAYTYGKSIDYYSGSAINELFATAGDQRDWRTNRGRSDFDRTNRFVFSGVYDLPKFDVKSKAADMVLNHWELATIAIFQSGLPFSVVDAPNNNIIQRANFSRTFSGNPVCSGSTQSCLSAYVNPTAFVLSRPILGGGAVGTVDNPNFDPNAPFGNIGRNVFTGPGQKNVDFSVVKFFPVNETIRAEFRTEFFNIFNWANFANPNNNVAVASTLGRITSTSAGPRVIQFAFKVSF